MPKIKLFAKLGLIFLFLLLIQGCMTGGYGRFYTPHINKQFPAIRNVTIYQYSDDGLKNLVNEGYEIIGSSKFNGRHQKQQYAVNQACKLGAEILLLNTKYTGSVQSSLTLPQYHLVPPTTVRTTTSGNVSLYGSGGSARGNYTEHSTTHINNPGYTTYHNIPITIHKYDHFAVFLRKEGNAAAKDWVDKSYQAAMDQEWAEVIRTASVAISLDPELDTPYVNRAWAYIEKGLLDMSINDCNKAIDINPNNADAINNRGLALSKKAKKEEAIKDYRKACFMGLEISCSNFKVLVGYLPSEEIGILLSRSNDSFAAGDYSQVVSLSTEVIKMKPTNAVAFSNRCAARVNQGLYNKAREDCFEAIRINPDYAMPYNNLGFVFEQEKNLKEAAVYYEISCGLGAKLGCENLVRLGE